MNRTSVTHPLQIAEIPFGAGMIGITFCPGKKGTSVFGQPWERDLAVDLEAIDTWDASTVVTLIEDHEFEILGVSTLPKEMEQRFKWHHIPIVDLNIPDAIAEGYWASKSEQFLSDLSKGEKILFHCRGGLGRAGTLAARLLMDGGMSADMAIQAVRSVRPGAIETEAQEDYLRTHPTFLSHASMLGTAIGDGLGAEIEFMGLARISAKFPDRVDKILPAYGQDAPITDDTQMALFTAEGLIRSHLRGMTKGICNPPSIIHHALLRWYVTQGGKLSKDFEQDVGLITIPDLHTQRAPGNTCLSALLNANLGEPAGNDSKGCGTIMRVAPVAFGVSRRDVRQLAIETSALTHGHITGQLAASFWAELLADVMEYRRPEHMARNLLDQYRRLDGGEEVVNAVEAALTAPRDGQPETVETLGGGWIAEECLAIALYAVLASDNAGEALSIAVKHSGDSDSCGAVAGSLVGILYPEEVINLPWAKDVELTEVIRKISKDLCNVQSIGRAGLSEYVDSFYSPW